MSGLAELAEGVKFRDAESKFCRGHAVIIGEEVNEKSDCTSEAHFFLIFKSPVAEAVVFICEVNVLKITRSEHFEPSAHNGRVIKFFVEFFPERAIRTEFIIDNDKFGPAIVTVDENGVSFVTSANQIHIARHRASILIHDAVSETGCGYPSLEVVAFALCCFFDVIDNTE